MSTRAGSILDPATHDHASDRSSCRTIAVTIAVFASLSLYCAIRSEGFIAADACVHYLYSRFALHEPMRLVDVWARPLVTALCAIPAALGGRLAVRVACMLVAVSCGLVAMTIARHQKLRWPALALIFTLGQPMLFLHSFGEMTELPFALVLGLAFLAFQKRRDLLATILISLTPLARPEGFGFVVLAAIALVLSRRWWGLLILPTPLIAWDIAGWLLSPRTQPWWRWLADAWPYAGRSLYGSGPLLTFLGQLPVIVSPLVLPATIVGIAIALRSTRNARGCQLLIALVPLFVLIVHSLLYWTGRMASFGEARYLLVAAPFWGVLSASGWEWFFARFGWRHPIRWAGAAVVVPVVVINLIHPLIPIPLADDWQTARSIAAWIDTPSNRAAYPRIMAAHPGVFYFLDLSPCDIKRTFIWDQVNVRAAPAHTVLIWDPIYSAQNASADHGITCEEITAAGWIPLEEASPPRAKTWRIFKSPR